MLHGKKTTFEIAGEGQVVNEKALEPPAQGFRFGRIFHGIPPFRPFDASLRALGSTITAKGESPDGPIPAGYTYFGQFVDHDITLDTTAGKPEDAAPLVDDFAADAIRQGRSPSLDLDSLYGAPGKQAELLDVDGARLRLGTTSPAQGVPAMAGFDVPRVAEGERKGEAIIGDDRNDENLIVQQMHVVFLRFHNKVVGELDAGADGPPVLLAAARQLVTRHYQWIVLNDFVARLADPGVFAEVVRAGHDGGVRLAPRVFKVTGPQTPPMPLEFSAAAFRLGHSMVRDTYSWNRIFRKGTAFKLFFVFSHLSGGIGRTGSDDPDKSFGTLFATFPSNWIADWRRMVPLEQVPGFPAFVRGENEGAGEIPLNMAKAIDTRMAEELGRLPFKGGNLAGRNLIRGARNGLPSGQDLADAVVAAGDPRAVALTPEEICRGLPPEALRVVREHEFDVKTPLWYYVLKEAEIRAGGLHLGPLGSRILVETFVALIRASRTSIFNADHATPGLLRMFDPARDSTLRVGGAPLTSLAHLIAYVGDANPLGDPPPAAPAAN